MTYLDSGILIKLYVDEPDSQEWRDRLQTHPDIVTSVLALPEVRSGLRQKVQYGALRAAVAREVWAEIQKVIRDESIRAIPLGQEVLSQCLDIYERLPRKVVLRTLDALHLATAATVQGCVVATTDRQMIAAAKLLSVPLL